MPEALPVALIEAAGDKPDVALLKGLGTRPGEPVEDARLTEDQRTLTHRLQDLGHFEASVVVDVPEEGGPQPVVFAARPGPLARVVEVEVSGPPLPPARDDEGPLELAARPELPYRVQDVAASRESLLSAWRRAGYLDAQLDSVIELSEVSGGKGKFFDAVRAAAETWDGSDPIRRIGG